MELDGGLPQLDSELAGLRARRDALRQTASLRGARLRATLEAALAELDAAIELLGKAEAEVGDSRQGAPPAAWHAERRLLRALFADAPVPLFQLGRDGTVRRANRSAGDALGMPSGYATGKPFTAFLNHTSRAAVETHLATVIRTGRPGQVRGEMLTSGGAAECELTVAPARLGEDEDQLIVAVGGPPVAAGPDEAASGHADPALVAAMTRRVDVVTRMTRLLLGSATGSEHVLVQECARLLAPELAEWVIVDMVRGQALRRQLVTGPQDQGSAALAGVAAGRDPEPGSIPFLVSDADGGQLVAHVADAAILGDGPGGVPLLMLLDATSLVSVPIADGGHRYGVLTLARRGSRGPFGLADLGLLEELGAQLALAIRAGRMLQRHTQVTDALRSALLPSELPSIPGVEVAAAHLTATESPEVGGDFYDVYQTPDGPGVILGEACGRGEGVAAASAVARHAARLLGRSEADPAAVLAGVNEVLLDEELAGRFVTACAARLRWRGPSLQVQLAGAGHPGPVLAVRDGHASQLPGGGLPLGVFPAAELGTASHDLSTGDVLVFVTDGVADCRGPDGNYFDDRLTGEIAAMAGQPAGQIVARLQQLALEFCGGEVRDDMTMLAFRVGEPPPRER
ncbi:MAG: SpoIIE family protein phosphatase [Nocardiopsaceae bacterium]|jgi:serine phosphatase RsbU (regulator of sigma subunit)/PAS domain-containing protein|nr:SpoIIE family protein phosphatase [Nocardiopsaceae bacterium]